MIWYINIYMVLFPERNYSNTINKESQFFGNEINEYTFKAIKFLYITCVGIIIYSYISSWYLKRCAFGGKNYLKLKQNQKNKDHIQIGNTDLKILQMMKR